MRLLDHSGNLLASAHILAMAYDDGKSDTAAKMREKAAARALAEAETRRQERVAGASDSGANPKETGGRDGPEPTRFGDWEKDGIISAF